MSYSLFYDVGVAVAAATILAVIFNLLKQPTILGYIVAGLLIGPVLGIVKDTAVLGNFSELGIALLLFIIGIELYKKGADYVVLPDQMAGEHIVSDVIRKKSYALRKLAKGNMKRLGMR